VVLLLVLIWLAYGFWNSVKPMPAGTHVGSLPARLGESQVEFIEEGAQPGAILRRELAFVDRAEQMIVLDQCPLARPLAEHLLARRRQRPNLEIVLVSDPRGDIYGGTPEQTLSTLEAAGIIVVRTRLERLRDPNPLYSSAWRLSVGWWSDPFDEVSDRATLASELRRRNDRADRRQLLVADDGAGGWSSLIASMAPRDPTTPGGAAVEVRGRLARDIIASELDIAAWSTDDDRLPAAPPAEIRAVGSIDARFLTEGAIAAALRDSIAVAAGGDSVSVAARALGDRALIHALLHAAARGAHVQLLHDRQVPANQAVAAELARTGAGSIDIRWAASGAAGTSFVLVQHRDDAWLDVGSAQLTRRALDDLNLEANIELHMPARAGPARAAADSFARAFAGGSAYSEHADESRGTYWRYRVAEATGLAMF
jgi:hypothetical protein